MRIVQLSEVQYFVKHTLKSKLQKDLCDLRILKESDVECCAYYHLRRLLKVDANWRVFARKFSPQTGYYTDLVIFHLKKAEIAIEIKWGKKGISKKDRKALASVRKHLGAKKTYFYCIMPDASPYKRLRQKKEVEKYRFLNGSLTSAMTPKRRLKNFRSSEESSAFDWRRAGGSGF